MPELRIDETFIEVELTTEHFGYTQELKRVLGVPDLKEPTKDPRHPRFFEPIRHEWCYARWMHQMQSRQYNDQSFSWLRFL
jgi:hypothetical protein